MQPRAKGRVILVRLTNIFIILNTDGRNITFIHYVTKPFGQIKRKLHITNTFTIPK